MSANTIAGTLSSHLISEVPRLAKYSGVADDVLRDGGLAEIENREVEGFVGYLQQRHKPSLDTTLTQLAQAQARAAARERQREIERSRGWKDQDQDRGYGE